MTHAQYIRIESQLPYGIWASDRAFIREARKILSPGGLTRDWRDLRHDWLRAGLEHLHDNQRLAQKERI